MMIARLVSAWPVLAFVVLSTCWYPAFALAEGGETQGPAASLRAQEDGPSPKGLATDPDVYLQLISRLQAKEMYFASLAHLDAFDRLWPGNQKATFLRAVALRETGYLAKAEVLYEKLLNGPLAADAYHGLGLIAAKRGDLSAALSALTKANQLDPVNASVLNDLGYVQILLGRLDDAGFALHKATELDPKDIRAGSNLALLYLLSNKGTQADGIMDWYKLSDKQRQAIAQKAAVMSGKVEPVQQESGAERAGQAAISPSPSPGPAQELRQDEEGNMSRPAEPVQASPVVDGSQPAEKENGQSPDAATIEQIRQALAKQHAQAVKRGLAAEQVQGTESSAEPKP